MPPRLSLSCINQQLTALRGRCGQCDHRVVVASFLKASAAIQQLGRCRQATPCSLLNLQEYLPHALCRTKEVLVNMLEPANGPPRRSPATGNKNCLLYSSHEENQHIQKI